MELDVTDDCVCSPENDAEELVIELTNLLVIFTDARAIREKLIDLRGFRLLLLGTPPLTSHETGDSDLIIVFDRQEVRHPQLFVSVSVQVNLWLVSVQVTPWVVAGFVVSRDFVFIFPISSFSFKLPHCLQVKGYKQIPLVQLVCSS